MVPILTPAQSMAEPRALSAALRTSLLTAGGVFWLPVTPGWEKKKGGMSIQLGNIYIYISINIKYNGQIPFASEEMTVMGNEALNHENLQPQRHHTKNPPSAECSASCFQSRLKNVQLYSSPA